MTLYRDLHIRNGELVLDIGNNPTLLSDRAVIAQDIVHALLDTGLVHLLLADRGSGAAADTKTRMVLLVEDDLRIMPGTVKVEQSDTGTWWLTADTIDFGLISTQLTAGA